VAIELMLLPVNFTARNGNGIIPFNNWSENFTPKRIEFGG